MSGHESLRVELGERGYDILVGEGLLATAGQHIAPLTGGRRLFVVTDEQVAKAHLAALERALDAAGVAYEALVLPPGEGTKDFSHLESLCQRLLAMNLERGSLLAALGGGVVGDLVGFAASILLRGLDFVQIPTTLLAQVDSSVGGKTGINVPQGKNLVGSFHQPRLVLADTEVLSTLPKRELLAGYAEVVKYGLINDAAFFQWLEDHGLAIVEGDPAARRHAIVTSCAAQAAIVAEDERESGARALLNLGHTFGHALEAELGYDERLVHGEAVAIGLVLAFELSVGLGLCPAADAAAVRRHVAAVGLPTDLESVPGVAWSADALIDHMGRDKKVRGGKVSFVLVRGIGKAFITADVDLDDVAALLTGQIAA
jgi:3-dehydroquinate synthase